MLLLLPIVTVVAALTVSPVTVYLPNATDEATVQEKDLRMLQIVKKAPQTAPKSMAMVWFGAHKPKYEKSVQNPPRTAHSRPNQPNHSTFEARSYTIHPEMTNRASFGRSGARIGHVKWGPYAFYSYMTPFYATF